MDQNDALKTYLTCLADDEFVLGHRMAEWTGQGPIIEEDIAFSSMAQDELGHALGLYELLHELGGPAPDDAAFKRPPDAFRNAVFTELPRGDYAFSLVRQFLYDAAENERMEALRASTHGALKILADRIGREERYHWIHGTSFVRRLASGTEESRVRMQTALDACFPAALGLFETYAGERELVEAGVTVAEDELRRRWLARVVPLLESSGLAVPVRDDDAARAAAAADRVTSGGRAGRHTEHLAHILDAMQMLSKADPHAEW